MSPLDPDDARVPPGSGPERQSADELSRRFTRGSALFTVGRLLSLLFTISTQVVVVRYLPVDAYGAFAYALVLVSTGRLLLSLGQGGVLSRFLSVFEEQGDFARMAGSLLLGVATVAVTGGLGLVVLLLLGEDVAASALGRPDLTTLLLVLVLLAPLEAVDELFIAVFATMTRARSIFVRKYLLVPGLRLAAAVAMVTTGQDALFLAVGYVGVQTLALVVYTALLVRILRSRGLLAHFRPSRVRVPVRAVFALAVPSLTGTVVYLSMNTGSVLLLSAFWGAAEIAAYRAVFPAARLNQFVFTAFSTLYLPMAARLFARGDREGATAVYWHTALLLAVFSFPVLAMTTVFAPLTTTTLFGDRYADSAPVLALLSLGYYLNAALGFNANTMIVHGRGRRIVAVNAVVAVGNLALCLALVPGYGAVGVAVANLLTLVLQNLLNQWGLTRVLATSFLDRSYARPYALVVAAAGALWLVDRALEPGFVVAASLVAATSIALVALTRNELRLAELFPELRRVPGVRLLAR